ncbi:MAG: DUF6120 family protein [Ruminococcus sp.]
MNKICKQYISEVKALFPIMGKNEKIYVNKLKKHLENYCEESCIASKQELYESYGQPNDIVNDFFSSADTEYIVKKIKISKYIKIAITSLLVIALATASIYCTILIREHEIFARQEVVICEQTIEEIE